mmetsp:Transcript_24548/g.47739  ORF Transcript_24548/g.47739 Transcript_24548/m.47739 type:complete len:682 (-) Transcript_24548:88-2133(-)
MQRYAVFALACIAACMLPGAVAQRRYPLSAVVKLLEDMRSELQAEADRDQAVYEKLACWCETNKKEKTKAIADAEVRIEDLGNKIEKNIALSETLTIEIKALKKELAKQQASLDEANAMREKQHTEFIAEEKEMVQSIQALDAAIVVLSRHHGGNALISSSSVVEAAAAAHAALVRHSALLQGIVSPSEQRMLQSLIQRQEPSKDFFGKKPGYKEAYAPQSGQIFGILKEMKATFEADLASSQNEEVQAAETHKALKAAKEEEMKAGQESFEDKQEQLAQADETKAQATEEREDTQASFAEDKKFLMSLKEKCSLTDMEWKQRQQMRDEEMAAVSEAITILSSDDSRELFNNVYNKEPAPALVQIEYSRFRRDPSVQRVRAKNVLMQAASNLGKPQLALLAMAAQLDAFKRVKKAIDDMVAQLVKEKDEEIKHRDYCINGLNKNELSTEKELHSKVTLEQKVEVLEHTVSSLVSTIESLKSDVTELQSQQKRASENREQQHNEFKLTIDDQREAKNRLTQAFNALKQVYAEREAKLIQVRRQQPPPSLKPYEKSKAAAPVLALLSKVIDDTARMIEATTTAEGEAQDAYTKLVQETSTSVEAKQASIVDRTAEKTQAEQDLLQAKTELEGIVTVLGDLASAKVDLHGECDFILKNFDMRQEARNEEVAALRQAKAYLSGEE